MAIYIERWPTLYALNTITELELTHTQNITGNYTTVSYAVRVKRINNYNDNWTPSGGSYTTLSIGGISVLNGARHNWTTLSNNANHTATVVSGSVNVPHAANGTKNIAYSLTFRPNISSISNMPDRVISGSFTPPAIPRVSKATISKASFNFGEAVTLTTNRASTAFTHKVYYIDSAGTVTLSTNMGASGSITVPAARMSSHTKTASVAMTIRVITVSGGVDIGTHNISVTVNVPSSVIPTVGSLAIAETVTKAAAVFSSTAQFISGVSRAKATAGSVSGVHGSTIARYYFQVKEVTSFAMNSTANNVTFPVFNFPSSGSNTYTIQVRVMDSRGRYSSWRDASAIRVHYYRPPTIGNPATIRLSTPTTLQVVRNYSVQAINQNGSTSTQRNTASYYIRTRAVGSTTWTTNTSAGNSELSLTNSSANLAGAFSASTMWEVQAVVTDKLNTATSAIITVSTEFATMEILKGTGIGVGKAPVAGQGNLQVGTGGIDSEGPIRANGVVINQGRHSNYKSFTVGGTANNYYPVIISSQATFGLNRYSISRGYNAPAPDTWNTATHRGGLTFDFEWTGDIAWGGNDKTVRVIEWNETYTTMVGGLKLGFSGGLIVWLRGGNAQYKLTSERGVSASIEVRITGFTDANNTNYPVRTSPVPTEIYSSYPVRGSGALYDAGHRVWSARSHGSGSGLDADLLDGNHASAFALASHTHSEYNTTYGTNTNGKYWRSGNMQTCTGKVTLSSGGNGYYYARTWTFPASFYSASEIYCSANVSTVPTSDNYMNWNGNATMHSATTTGVSMWWAGTHDTKTLSGTVTLDVIAIGRWKA